MEEVNDVEIAGGVHLGHLGRGAGQFVELREHIDLQLCLVGNGDQMHNRISRAAHGHAGLDGVANAAISDDLPCGNFLFYQLHDLHAGLLSQSQTTSRGSGSQAGVRQGHTQGLRQCAHGVGSAQVRAGATARAGSIFQRDIFLFGDLTGREHTVGLCAGGLVGLTAVKHLATLHGAAGQQNAGNIQPGGSHQHTGNDLITGTQQYQSVELVDLGHGLN